ncbi:MAG: response regulator [Burkholderiales bacterium]|nr:response regulator [Burkholderiales bacterium]
MSALRNVLVVDDDPVVSKSFNRVLTAKGYTVIHAQNGAQALEQLRQIDVDLVVTDIRMPGMDGLELAEAVKARKPWTPVVIVTGYGTEADEARAKAAGVSVFLHKPVSPELMQGAADEAMRAPAPVARVAEVVAAPLAATPEVAPAAGKARAIGRKVWHVALFFAAPFIGLLYAVMMPVVGLGTLAWLGGKAMLENGTFKRMSGAMGFAAKGAAAPFVGLAFAVFFPIIGLGALAWMGSKALFTRAHAE